MKTSHVEAQHSTGLVLPFLDKTDLSCRDAAGGDIPLALCHQDTKPCLSIRQDCPSCARFRNEQRLQLLS